MEGVVGTRRHAATLALAHLDRRLRVRLDQRFADANVTGIDTTLSPASVDTDERYNVLVPAHLEGLGLQIPQCDRITLEECA